ncbi:MAG TPA: D-aminoacyl-tRNA deacylase [Bacillota bacterium]|nr:D-aminoacyl-tRNA deacylase [Bacillota bacterium]HPT86663.1 D-aminoacyl-tRNA deacylase [Bacillota bacterium]
MRALIQRVSWARVRVSGEIVGRIDEGLLVLLGVGNSDTLEDLNYLTEKIVHLRIFADEAGKLNLSLIDRGLPILAVSQFTLYADCRKGRRPYFGEAAPPDKAVEMYEQFCIALRNRGVHVEKGIFQAHMEVELCNDGPVTIWLDSSEK